MGCGSSGLSGQSLTNRLWVVTASGVIGPRRASTRAMLHGDSKKKDEGAEGSRTRWPRCKRRPLSSAPVGETGIRVTEHPLRRLDCQASSPRAQLVQLLIGQIANVHVLRRLQIREHSAVVAGVPAK